MRRLAMLALTVLAVGLGACGGDDSESSTDDASAAPSEDQQAQFQEFRDCLSEQGLEMPEPGSSPEPPASGQGQQPDQEMTEAFEACQELMPEGAPGGGAPQPGSFPGAPSS